jgi:hypothetical protein
MNSEFIYVQKQNSQNFTTFSPAFRENYFIEETIGLRFRIKAISEYSNGMTVRSIFSTNQRLLHMSGQITLYLFDCGMRRLSWIEQNWQHYTNSGIACVYNWMMDSMQMYVCLMCCFISLHSLCLCFHPPQYWSIESSPSRF